MTELAVSNRLGMSAADVASLPREAMPALLAELAALQTAVAARLAAVPEESGNGEDGLVSVEAAVALVGLKDNEAFLRREAFRPAVVKIGHRTTVVNMKKLRRILAAMEA